jgi:hypothetical protein
LASVPGVGKATLRTLIAELPELGHLNRRKIDRQEVEGESPLR